MKRNLLSFLTAGSLVAMVFTSCGTSLGSLGSLQGNGQSQGMLESVLGTLLGGAIPVTEQSVIGTWNYNSPDVRFESENALTKAGGMVAAQQVEAKLADTYKSIGITPGSCSFTFGNNNACTLKIGGQNISGKYSINSNTHDFTFASSTGLIKLNGKVYCTGNTLTVLFDAQKLLSIAQTVSAVTGQGSATISTLSALLNQYQGMMLGMNLNK